jgi:hypothetical protein
MSAQSRHARQWKTEFAKVTTKINNRTATEEDHQEYVRLLNSEPDDPDGFLDQIVRGCVPSETKDLVVSSGAASKDE